MSTPNPIDVVFSFDTTGSMYPCLTQVRRVVSDVTQRLFQQIPNLHIGIITHGDYCDGDNVMTTQDLTDNEKLLVDFIKTAPSTGGGDAPECYELVLHKARQLSWRSGKDKVLVLIGDDVPHGPSYRENTLKLDWQNELGLLKEAGVHVYGVQALARSHATHFYRDLAKLSDGVHLELHQFNAIVDLVMAVCYKQVSPEAVVSFEKEVQDAGRMTDSVGAMFDVLIGRIVREVHKSTPYRAPTSRGGKVAIKSATVNEADLTPVHPSRFQVLNVDAPTAIKNFVTDNGLTFKVGRGFYEFTKTVEVQAYKEVVLINKSSGAMWTGAAARSILGLPNDKTVKLAAGAIPGYTVFIQSTSNNRKLLGGTKFLYEVEDTPS
jgi:hypothetical protein